MVDYYFQTKENKNWAKEKKIDLNWYSCIV